MAVTQGLFSFPVSLTDGDHAYAPARRRVAVRAEGDFPGRCEPLEVDLMAYAVAGPGEVGAELLRRHLEEKVVVGVHEIRLEHVVIDVRDGKGHLDPVYSDGLEFEPCHGPGSVLRVYLIDAHPDGTLRCQLSVNTVSVKDLLNDVPSHSAFLF